MSFKLLQKLVDTPTPSGSEEEISEIMGSLRYRNFRMYRAPNNSIYFVMNRKSPRTIILDAHIDQVHARIRTIRDDGIILAKPIGFNAETFSGQRVIVHGEKRDIPGLIQSTPPHLNKVTKEDNVKRNKFMYIDTGLSKAELEREIINGDSITFDAVYREIGRHLITGPGLDNKASAFILINLMRRLDSHPPGCNIIVNFSSREEVGGATISHISHKEELKELMGDDVTLIVLDTHVATKGSVVNESDLELGVDIGRGVSIENDATTSQEVLRRFQSIARKHKIPVQFQYTDFGGTNKKNYDLYMNTKGINMGVPLRNMHSAVETVDKRDLKSAEDLIYYYITS